MRAAATHAQTARPEGPCSTVPRMKPLYRRGSPNPEDEDHRCPDGWPFRRAEVSLRGRIVFAPLARGYRRLPSTPSVMLLRRLDEAGIEVAFRPPRPLW